MHKKRILFLLLFFVTSKCFSDYNYRKISIEKAKQLIEEFSESINGYILMEGESDYLKSIGGAPTYGEITFDSMQYLLQNLDVKDTDIFYDLGSGVGKAVLQTYLTTPVKRAVGVELSRTRHYYASLIKKKFVDAELLDDQRILEFKQEDITDTDFSDATIIYICSVCYSDELMQALTKKIIQLPAGVRIATLKQLSAHERLVPQKIYTVPVNWHPRALIYLYKVI